jgi:hypothetical protein
MQKVQSFLHFLQKTPHFAQLPDEKSSGIFARFDPLSAVGGCLSLKAQWRFYRSMTKQ